ncbi:MAG: fibrillarin-like rRNA/tRNA 2'-O-methyltransferase [Thermoplasmatota archaeon]
MKPTGLGGVWDDRGLLWTRNAVPGTKVYAEPLRLFKGTEYRGWSAWRSKLAALVARDRRIPWFTPSDNVLYLGAASGTTVSHLSDLLPEGAVYAVEFSPRSMRDLAWNAEPRANIVPILEDAGAPARYAAYIGPHVDALVQDVAQRHQVAIFLRNLPFLRSGGKGYLFVKARSISVASSPGDIYRDVERQLTEAGLKILKQVDLDPFEKDHRAFVVEKP